MARQITASEQFMTLSGKFMQECVPGHILLFISFYSEENLDFLENKVNNEPLTPIR